MKIGCIAMLGRSLASVYLKCEEARKISPKKAECRGTGKEKNERHEHQSNLAQVCAITMASTQVVQDGLTLMAHGVHDPPWGLPWWGKYHCGSNTKVIT
jgi:hypothetical protein